MAELYQYAKERLGNFFGQAAQPVQQAAPVLTTPTGASRLLGTAPEKAGYTSTGGRRHGKTRRHRKARKSLRRR